MKNANSMIFLFFGLAMFVTAASIAMYLASTTTNGLDKGISHNGKMDRNQQTVLKTIDTYTMTGGQVLQSINLIADVGCDIVVKNTSGMSVTFVPTIDVKRTDVSIVDVTKKYIPAYTRGSDGSLTMLTFTAL